jgi:molecular chaperone Hsp33
MDIEQVEDSVLSAHFRFIAPDGIDVFLLEGGLLRGSLLHGTRLINQMRANHGLGIMETLILGHAYMAAGLLTAMMKGDDRIAVGIDCTGPARGLSVESSASGGIRGYLKRNPIPIESPPLDLSTAPYIGGGVLSVTKYLHGSRSPPYTGQVKMESGTIAGDMAHYFLVSEQMPTSFSLSVYFDPAGRATGAAGLFLQAFPGVAPERVERIEAQVRGLPSLGTHFAFGGNGRELIEEGFGAFAPELIARRGVRFECPCSRERFGGALASLSGAEARSIRAEGPFPLETVCSNCGSRYRFSQEEIGELMAKA